MDTQGPSIRTGVVASPFNLHPGDLIDVTVRGAKSEEKYSVDVDYDNFKSKVAKVRGNAFTASLHNVWSAMLNVEDEDARDGEAHYVDPNN
jgi:hypothetical protein